MINPNELRIGNLVQRIGWVYRVVGIKDDDVFLTYEDSDAIEFSIFDGVQPIPLTRDWLIKLGFEYQDYLGLFTKAGYDVQLLEGGVEFYLPEYGDWFKLIEHVHQLQNLYFALTEEEL